MIINDYLLNNITTITTVTLAVMVLASFIVRKVTLRLRAKYDSIHQRWNSAIWNSARWPAHLFIWLFGWLWLVQAWVTYLGLKNNALWIAGISKSRNLIIVVLVTVFIISLLSNMEKWISAREKGVDGYLESSLNSIMRGARIAVVVIALFMTVDVLGYDISNLLVAGGVGGIVLGFAAKDMLSNVFGALSIYLDRPFTVGDIIEVPEKNISGKVEQISLRLTKIRNFDRQSIHVPNGIFAQSILVNRTRMTHRRLDEFIGIRYDDIHVVEAIAKEIQAMLDEHKDIDSGESRLCYISRFGPSSVDIRIYVFTKIIEWEDFHHTKQDILMKIAAIINKNGAKIAYPTQTLHIDMPDDAKASGADNAK